MNFAACSSLPRFMQTGTWYRCIDPRFLPTALSSAHTKANVVRFNGGAYLAPALQYECLSFADDPTVAMFEVGAVMGRLAPGKHIPNPRVAVVTLNVNVHLSQVADLTDLAAQVTLDASPQELTGDWEGYRTRSHATPVTAPTGFAPTQELGLALFQAGFEGFISLSARVPYNRTLTIFPGNFGPRSSASFTQNGSSKVMHSIP